MLMLQSEREADTVVEQFVERLPTRGGVLVNNNCLFPIPQTNSIVLVQLFPNTLHCWPLTRSELQVCSLTVATEAEEFDEKHLKSDDIVENSHHRNR